MTRPILIACVSDIHAGSALALCPEEINLDDGGKYLPSKAQSWYWQNWSDYWIQAAAKRDALDAELYVILNGDLVDGQVKHSTQILSGNPNAQAAVFNAAVAIPRALKPDHLVVVRGTEAHVGNSASAEERIADGLWRNGDPIIRNPATDTSSWWHWVAELQGVKIDVTHHGRIGQREHTRASQIVLYAHDVHLTYTKRGERPPDLALRAHNHKWADSYDAVKPRVVGTGAWQAGTGHVHRVQPDSLADCGGVLVTIQDGSYEVDKVKYEPEQPVWRPAA